MLLLWQKAETPQRCTPLPLAATEEDGGWVYYDSDGYRLTDTWKREGDSWYYLDSDGMRASNLQVDEYYVGEDGKRVANTWISIENEDYSYGDDEPEFYWYYYGKDGKMSASRWVKIDGHSYYFNEEGRMINGSVNIDGDNYYLGEEGDGKMKNRLDSSGGRDGQLRCNRVLVLLRPERKTGGKSGR